MYRCNCRGFCAGSIGRGGNQSVKIINAKVDTSQFEDKHSTDIRNRQSQLPYRINLGGFLDQPKINSVLGGFNIVCSINCKEKLDDRSGAATSTRKTLANAYNGSYPYWIDNKTLARILFALENPPGSDTKYISGTTDSIGLVTKGITKLRYDTNQWWPSIIEQNNNLDQIKWLEKVLWLKQTHPRPNDLGSYLDFAQPNPLDIQSISRGTELIWNAIQKYSLVELQEGMRKTYAGSNSMVSSFTTQEMHDQVVSYDGASIIGAGGGGYMIIASQERPENSIEFTIN